MTALWTIPALLGIGAAALIAFTAFIFHGLDDQGEPMEYAINEAIKGRDDEAEGD